MHIDPEQLGKAVLKQALVDAGVGMKNGERIGVNAADRVAARNSLTAAAGCWKEAREFWASMADLCPDKLRSGTMKLLGIEARPSAVEAQPLILFQPVPKPPKLGRNGVPRGPDGERRTKIGTVLEMLKRDEGVSVDELVERFGWARATAISALRGDLRKFGVMGERGYDGRYRLVTLP